MKLEKYIAFFLLMQSHIAFGHNHFDENHREKTLSDSKITDLKPEQLLRLDDRLGDSINGIYIPKDLRDCFITLDSILTKEDIDLIKNTTNSAEAAALTDGLERWIRNNWGLWGGSRLHQYFVQRKIIDHADVMSSFILGYYRDWLRGDKSIWKKFEKKYPPRTKKKS